MLTVCIHHPSIKNVGIIIDRSFIVGLLCVACFFLPLSRASMATESSKNREIYPNEILKFEKSTCLEPLMYVSRLKNLAQAQNAQPIELPVLLSSFPGLELGVFSLYQQNDSQKIVYKNLTYGIEAKVQNAIGVESGGSDLISYNKSGAIYYYWVIFWGRSEGERITFKIIKESQRSRLLHAEKQDVKASESRCK